jgi:hypothetical protein
MHAGSLYQSLRTTTGFLDPKGLKIPDHWSQRWMDHRRDVAQALERAHKFVIPTAAGIIADQDLYETALEFFASRTLRLPYPNCYFEFGGVVSIKDKLKSMGIVASERPGFVVKLSPYTLRSDGSWLDSGFYAELEPGKQWRGVACATDSEAQSDYFRQMLSGTARLLLVSVLFMSTKHARLDRVAAPRPAVAARRVREGRPPLYEYHTVTIRHEAQARGQAGGTHASPRLHWRRGHIRHLGRSGGLGDQRAVPVRPALVGVGDYGGIDKDYLVAPAGKAGPPRIAP